MNSIKTTTYVGENGGKAILIEGSNGMYMLEIIAPNGKLIILMLSEIMGVKIEYYNLF
jgi:hypothetical protein